MHRIDSGAWKNNQALHSIDGWYGDWFGERIAIYGKTMVVGAPGKVNGNVLD